MDRGNRGGGLSYTGVLATTPPDLVIYDHAPTARDGVNSMAIGTIWINNQTSPTVAPTVKDIYILTSVAYNTATWVNFGGGGVQSISGSLGIPVFPTIAGDIGIITDIPNLDFLEDVINHRISLNSTYGGAVLERIKSSTDGLWTSPDNTGDLILTAGAGVTINHTGANAITIGVGPGPNFVSSLVPDDAQVILPDNAGEIFVHGINGITTTGNIAGHSITIDGGTIAVPAAIITTYNVAGNYVWHKAATTNRVEYYIWNAGGGGGSGYHYTAPNVTGFGGAGGGGGSVFFGNMPAVWLSATENVVVGAGGAGGAAWVNLATQGANDGISGGCSAFANIIPSLFSSNPPDNLGGGGTAANMGHSGGSGRIYFIWSAFNVLNGNPGGGNIVGLDAIDIFGDASGFCDYIFSSGGGAGGQTGGGAGGHGGNIYGWTHAVTWVAGGVGGAAGVGNPGGNGNVGGLIGHGIFTGSTGGGGGSCGAAGGMGGGYGAGGGGGGACSAANQPSGAGGRGADGAVVIIEYA